MSTFLAEVLATAGEVERTDLDEKLSDITQKISALKCEVVSYIEESYINFSVMLPEHITLASKAKKLSEDMAKLSDRVENQIKQDLRNSTGELKSLSSSLQEVCLTLKFVNQIVNIDEALQASSEAHSKCEYFEEAKKLREIRDLLDQAEEWRDLKIFNALTLEKVTQDEQFHYEMMEIWNSCIKWEGVEAGDGCPRVGLRVDTARAAELEHTMRALSYLDHLDYTLRKFASKLMKFVLKPVIITDSCVNVLMLDLTAVLEVDINSVQKKPSYKIVFSNLVKILQFFHMYLNANLEEDKTFLSALGDIMSEEFCECLIKECLCDTIPSHGTELQSFAAVAADIEGFQAELVTVGFLHSSDQSILSYAKNVDILCANKECQVILEKAQHIMKKDLHDMVLVHPTDVTEILYANPTEDTTTFCPKMQPDIELSENTFQFPLCQISKSAVELVDLVRQVLDEASRSSEMCCVRLLYTARNITELYAAVVPTYHRQFLDTIPQQVALFHNNCMYLAHHLMTLGHEFKGQFPTMLPSSSLTFVDQVCKLRELGTSTFLKQMQVQRKQILDILRDSGLDTLGENPKLPLKTEKAMRQCIRQVELLQTVWQHVLPENVYCKVIGCLLNSCVEELVMRVITVEDIPADTAVRLVAIFEIISERAPKIFKEPTDVRRYVKHWLKFRELVLVLGASLRDIEDRWADGKGPLAHEFTPDQVKKLIRALFQNTERRSSVLARIK